MSIVVAYTPDAFGRAAVEHGSAEAVRRNERLVVVNVTRGASYVDKDFAPEADVAELREHLAELPVEAEVRQSMGDDVAEEVIAVAQKESAELVVVGVRRRTQVGKLFLGSVAQRVILDARCPVLAVKPAD